MGYWENRQKQLNSQLEKDEAKLKKRLSSFYDAEYRKLEKEIASYYIKYGENNVIQYRKLMESLPAEDKRLLMERMNEFAEKYPQYEHLMPVRESIYKLNRLEGLQISIRMQQLEIGAVNNDELTKHLNRNGLRSANAAAEAMGFGKNFYAHTPNITKLFVNTAWCNGKNFSQRIWGNTDKLANYLSTDVAQALARGDSYDRIVRNMRKRFGDVSRNDMYRLIYSEGTYVMAESSMQPFIGEFEKYRVSPVDDGKACTICKSAAEQVFNIEDRQPGINFPPFHPWCRCTFTIEVDDWDKWMDDYEKRHSNGQSGNAARRLNDKTSEMLVSDEKGRYTKPKGADLSNWKKKIVNVELEHDAVLTNANYKKGIFYQVNCQRCVPAYEMRRRGYDVMAKPVLSAGEDIINETTWRNIFENAKWLPCGPGSGLSYIETAMKKFGDGARAEIYILWDNQKEAHVFVAEQRMGKTVFIDPQDGTSDARDYFKYVCSGHTEICRIDNLEPSELISECCEVYKYD